MKQLFKVALVAGCMLLAGSFAKAQTKVAYIDFGAVMEQMPQAKTINTQITAYQKTFTDQLQTMQNELQTKNAAYEKSRASMTDAARTVSEGELQDLYKRLQDSNNSFNQQVQAKSAELIKPLSDQVRTAITTVAKEKGYNYVLDSGQTALIVSPPSDDLMPAVKLKLGIK
ncbi:OmpH family outer membrane protein [Mucilaginibacter robiniae]|uniref:OmpH family outer membrane protein n=1 Tax=Mucilaginibacter robiniae TaxID=2728022 RepID=A0A7L5DUD8_9SPHI|nr:OmpH family outer membrane protein [Mucilaginibacter robiniae]QJD94672.1 OmpH family outer membrane protein [Mucilaginibacter robiniae]